MYWEPYWIENFVLAVCVRQFTEEDCLWPDTFLQSAFICFQSCFHGRLEIKECADMLIASVYDHHVTSRQRDRNIQKHNHLATHMLYMWIFIPSSFSSSLNFSQLSNKEPLLKTCYFFNYSTHSFDFCNFWFCSWITHALTDLPLYLACSRFHLPNPFRWS